MRLSRRGRAIALVLAVAAVTHALAILAFPRALMRFALSRIEARAGTNRAYAAPRPDHTFRDVVRPSPDLLYSVCVIDLDAAGGAVEVDATLPSTYGSIAFYDESTNVVDVLRDRDFPGGVVRAKVVGPRTPPQPDGGARRIVRLPSARGLLLGRVLVSDPAALAELERARRGLVCVPARGAP